jgi:hypothetical protein
MNKESIYVELVCLAQQWEDRACWEDNPEISDRLAECAQQVRAVISTCQLGP